MTLLVPLLCGLAAAAPPASVDLTATSEALGTLALRVGLRSTRAVRGAVGVDLPLTLWVVTAAPDAARAVGTVEASWTRGRFAVDASAAARVSVTADRLGARVGLDAGARVEPGLALGDGGAGVRLRLGGEQALATLVTFSDPAREAFVGSGTPPPTAGVLPFGATRGVLGLGGRAPVAPGWTAHAAVDAVTAVDPLGLTLGQEAMLGLLPLRLEIGLTRRW